MDITHLRYFLKTAERLNYTRASEELFITRQSLRQALASMEAELGKPLFLNVRNKLSLTEYGAYMAVAGAEVVRSFDGMMEGMRQLVNRQAALRVGFSDCLFPFMLPDTEIILRTFRAQFPDIRLEIVQLENDGVIDAVEQGTLDCGCVIQMPCKREGVAMRRLCSFEAAVDFSDGSPLCGKREVELDDLVGLSMIGMGSLEKTLRPLWEACAAKGIALSYRPVSSTIDAFYLIQHGLAAGFDILKTDVPDFDGEHIALLKGYTWEIGFLSPIPCANPPLLELFCSFVEKQYQVRRSRYLREWNIGASSPANRGGK